MSDRSGVVLSDDLRITGEHVKIICRGKLRVDRKVEGDVAATEVVIGERGNVIGTVAGDRVVVFGKVFGAIHGKAVSLQCCSHVEGDIHHASLTIEKGAEFDGRSRTGSHESSQTLRGRVGDTVASPVPTRAVRLSGVGAVNGGAGPA